MKKITASLPGKIRNDFCKKYPVKERGVGSVHGEKKINSRGKNDNF